METEIPIPPDILAQPQPVRIQAPGIRFWMGDMRAISMVLPIQEVVQQAADNAIYREDFELDGKAPGNRLERAPWVEQIKQGISENADRMLLGAFIFAVDPDGVVISKRWPNPEANEGPMDVQVVGIRSGYRLFILDAQHRTRAVQKLWAETIAAVRNGDLAAADVSRLLRRSSVPVVIVLEADPAQISRMFVTMASTRPIPTALVVAMDSQRPVNRLGLAVAKKMKLLRNGGPAGRLEYQAGTPKADKLYTAAVIRTASSIAVIGFKDRTPVQRETNLKKELSAFSPERDAAISRASTWIAEVLDYAADRMPGWKDVVAGSISPEDLREDYLLGSGAAMYVIAGVVAATRAAGLDYKPVIDAVAQLPWKRRDVINGKDPAGEPTIAHRFFESLLVKSEYVRRENGALDAKYSTAGGNRTQYEAATRKVLEHLAADERFKALVSSKVLVEIGLEAARERGRPKSNPAAA
jgi:hypothetical protein